MPLKIPKIPHHLSADGCEYPTIANLLQSASLHPPLSRVASDYSAHQVFCVRRFQRRIVVQSFSARRCPAAIHPSHHRDTPITPPRYTPHTTACRKRSVAVFCFRRYSAAYSSFPAPSPLLPRSFLEPSIYAQYMLNIC